MDQKSDSAWFTNGIPAEGVVVIIEYKGEWPGRGTTGIADAYTWNGKWFNLPSTIRVARWMYIPE